MPVGPITKRTHSRPVPHKPVEVEQLCQSHSRMFKSLRAQPMIIADHTIPRIPYERGVKHIRQLIRADNAIDVRKR